ncbi:MAG: hypothetical protein ACRCSF_07225, partial [Mycobacteriaceae bacterium]
RSMKDAALRGSEAATYVGVGAILVCTVIVAVLLPWKPREGDSMLLAWREEPDAPEKNTEELVDTH